MEIKFENVSFIINRRTPLEKTILSDVSFEITKIGIYSFLGSSNSGKTAVGDLINALTSPTKGKITIGKFINDGKRIDDISELRLQTGYVFKNPYDMFFNRTVKKELEFGMKYFKYKLHKIQFRASDALKLVGLDDSYLDKKPMELSYVDAKKVALASVLIYNPKIIILDEFTNGLGNHDKKEFLSILRTLKNKYDKTIILLSKDTNFCYQISDHVYIMHLTRLVTEGDKTILRDTQLLKNNNLDVPNIVSFIECANKKGHEIDNYNNIHDLIKGVYRDVF